MRARWMLAVLVILGGCSDGDMATSPDLAVTAAVVAGDATTGGEQAGGPGVASVTECDEVGLVRAGVRWQVDGRHQLLLFVPMSPEIGEPYVNVWTPEVNATFLGRGPANEWFGVSLPGFGSWRIRLAAETIDHTGRVRQCDRHRFVVLAKPPPPPPECEVEPRCGASLKVQRGDERRPGVWIWANWEVENWCGQLELRRDGDVVRSWDACSDSCVAAVDEGHARWDSFKASDMTAAWTLACKQE